MTQDSPVLQTPADAALPAETRAASLLSRIESIPFVGWHTRARIVMGSATFLDAFDALSIAFVLPVLIGRWHIEPIQIGYLIGSSYIGQFIGALYFGALAERIGRTRSATFAIPIMSLMGVGCALSTHFWMLFAFRFVQGIGVGGEMPVAASYISELSNSKGRGKYFMLYELLFPIGLMAAGQIGTVLVPQVGWSSLFWAGAVPGLIVACLVWRLPESPRWLIGKGRLDEAEAIVRDIEASTTKRITPQPRSTTIGAGVEQPRIGWRELLGSVYRSRTLIVWTLWATAFFVSNSLNNWLPTLYRTVYHLPLTQALRYATLTNVAQVLLLLACAFCIDRIGRRNWTVTTFVIGAVLLAWLGLFGSNDVMSVVVVATLSYGLIASNAAVLYLYTPEVYPTRMRAVGTGLASSWLRLASAVGPTLVGLLVRTDGVGSVFLMFTGVSLVGAVAATRMIETRERRLENIAP